MTNSSSQPPVRRKKTRRRTRLRSGKIADIDGNFITECQIFDRSEKGARLRLAELCDLPNYVKLYDDELDFLIIALIIWIEGKEVGIEFTHGPGNIETKGSEYAALSGRYYAVK